MLRVLNLGAGVQSTTLYLWALDGLLQIDRAIFADTGDEPEAVYRHLDFLKTLGGPEIEVVRASSKSLGENLQSGMNATGQENQRHVAIPTFLKSLDGSAPALGRRQCTAEYKIRPIEQRVRDLCGLEKGERAKQQLAVQVMGLSFDEPRRVANVKQRFQSIAWSKPEFPLFDEYMTRADCVSYLERRLPKYAVPRSACVFCPFKSDAEWLHLQQSPSDWNHAVEIDRAIRDKTSLCTVGMRHEQFLHRSCVPLDQVQFVAKPPDAQKKLAFSTMDCEGMCGV
jgi:hypothetical protein